jgi:hypothetical protein
MLRQKDCEKSPNADCWPLQLPMCGLFESADFDDDFQNGPLYFGLSCANGEVHGRYLLIARPTERARRLGL